MSDASELGRGEIGPEPTLTWRQVGACKGLDPDIFFPEYDDEAQEAKEVCGGCVVRLACLAYALETREKHGVWGGATEQERRRIIRLRNRNTGRSTD